MKGGGAENISFGEGQGKCYIPWKDRYNITFIGRTGAILCSLEGWGSILHSIHSTEGQGGQYYILWKYSGQYYSLR